MTSLMWTGVLRDAGDAARELWRARGLTLLASVVLGLGVALNLVVFVAAQHLLLRPFPAIPDADRLVQDQGLLGFPHYRELAGRTQTMAGLAAFWSRDAVLTGALRPEEVAVVLVSPNYFDVVGAPMARGRGFRSDEGSTPGRDPVVVLGHTLWQQHFGGAEDIVGQRVDLNGLSLRVVGVAASGFRGTRLEHRADLFVPFTMVAALNPEMARFALFERAEMQWLTLVGRLGRDVSPEQATAELNTLYVNTREVGLPVRPSGDETVALRTVVEAALPGETRGTLARTLMLLAITAGLVLLLAVVNVGSLQLVRHEARRHELGVRLALGASRGRLIRQRLLEAVVLAGVAAGVALPLAYWTTDVLSSLALGGVLPVALDARIDGRVVGLGVALSAAAALACGLVPAWQSARRDLLFTVHGRGTPSRASASRLPWRRLLIVAQTATCTVLLVCSVLFVVTVQRQQTIDLGFDTDRVMLARFNQTLARHTTGGDAVFGELIDRIRALPEVTRVASARREPLGQSAFTPGVGTPEGSEQLTVNETWVGAEYFTALGITLRGRSFSSDTAEQEVIVNEALAARLWPGEEPLGRMLVVGVETDGRITQAQREVVGVARNTVYRTLHDSSEPILFRPSVRQPYSVMLVRTALPIDAALPRLRETFAEVAPDLPVELVPLGQHVDGWLARPRALAVLVGGFSGIAWMLALAGLYGLLSYLVARRTREIGVRMALGADPGRLLRSVLGQGAMLAAIGAGLGLVAAIAIARFVRGFLYGVEPTDPLVLATVGLGVLLVALAASVVPARRAAAVDPVEALRRE